MTKGVSQSLGRIVRFRLLLSVLLQRTDGQAEGAPRGLIHQHSGNGQGADAARIGQQHTDGHREPDRHQLHRGGSRLGILGLLGGAETADEALAQIERGNDALWRAASLRTRLVYLESADRTLRTAVAEAGYCPITINTSDFTRSGTHWADTALKWAGRSTSVRLYLGAESGVSSSLGTALSRLRAESCTIAALNEVTA